MQDITRGRKLMHATFPLSLLRPTAPCSLRTLLQVDKVFPEQDGMEHGIKQIEDMNP